MLFPHSIAGPIFRWKDLVAQFATRGVTAETVMRGVARFSFGLTKKVLVADMVAPIVDGVFALPANEVSSAYAWVGALGYAVQIYFDFSGYSDMAIGLGAMLGFSFRENFREPYTSRSIAEFWTRWHISLSAWLRDYLYIALGGNRRGRIRAGPTRSSFLPSPGSGTVPRGRSFCGAFITASWSRSSADWLRRSIASRGALARSVRSASLSWDGSFFGRRASTKPLGCCARSFFWHTRPWNRNRCRPSFSRGRPASFSPVPWHFCSGGCSSPEPTTRRLAMSRDGAQRPRSRSSRSPSCT
jgi:hypothetical protein